jgi:hypothetical protein
MNEMRSPGSSPPSRESLNHDMLKKACNAMAAGMNSADRDFIVRQ